MGSFISFLSACGKDKLSEQKFAIITMDRIKPTYITQNARNQNCGINYLTETPMQYSQLSKPMLVSGATLSILAQPDRKDAHTAMSYLVAKHMYRAPTYLGFNVKL